MKSLSKFMTDLPLPIKSVVITVMTLLFSHFVVYDFMSLSFFSPMEKAADFRFSDFYTIVADDRAVATLDDDVVIVPLDGMTRREMARVIDDVNFCSPAAVGLDIAFAPPSNPDDDPLATALQDCDKLVMPVRVMTEDDGLHSRHVSYYDSIVNPSAGFAAVNIQGETAKRSTVREFAMKFDTKEGVTLSMPLALASIARPDKVKEIADKTNDDQFISFPSRRFDIINPDEIIDNPDLIEGKIVLMGKLQNAGDLHVTPLDNFTPGLLIHAHTIATILDGNFIRTLTDTQSYIIAAIACYLIVLLNMLLWEAPVGSLVVRAVQMLMLYLMIIGGTMAYINLNIDLNFAFAIMTTTLGVAACEVYIGIFAKNGLCDLIARLFKKNRQS